MSREHLKFFLPLPTGHIVGKMHMSSKCTQHVITGFQVPSPPVTSRDARSSVKVVGEEVGHADEAVREVVRRVLFREDRMVDW